MFTKIRMRNFRSFRDLTFDLCEKSDTPKHIAVVYGENGSGKSNLASVFVLLNELMQTMDVRDQYEELLQQKSVFSDENLEQLMRQRLLSGMRDIRAIIQDYRMVDNAEPIVVDYEFMINEYLGSYSITLGEQEIIHEHLEYRLNRRRGVYFDCSREEITINKSIVTDRDLFADIKQAAKKYWGKHSLLAIIQHELDDKSEAYGQGNITGNFEDVLYELRLVSCYIGYGTRDWESLFSPFQILNKPISGKMSVDNEEQLALAEQIFSSFFSAINSNVKGLSYRKTYTDRYIDYTLQMIKYVAGEYRTIDFARESKGTYQLLMVLCYLLVACLGGIVILDEADSAIHDLLFKKIIQEIAPEIKGQIIFTTHNTMLMEADLNRNSIYVLLEEEKGEKLIRCISDYVNRTYITNNLRNKYLHGEYGGLPDVSRIDFANLILSLAEKLMQ